MNYCVFCNTYISGYCKNCNTIHYYNNNLLTELIIQINSNTRLEYYTNKQLATIFLINKKSGSKYQPIASMKINSYHLNQIKEIVNNKLLFFI